MNHFIGCASVVERHVVMLDDGHQMIYSGPLSGVSEIDFNRARVSLVSPITLQWIKERADEVIRAGKVRLI